MASLASKSPSVSGRFSACRSTAESTIWLFLIGGFVVAFFASRRLWHTDLWDHVNYGRFMLTNATIPQSEPLLVSSQGAPFVSTAWLSQVTLAALVDSNWPGLSGVQFVYALLIAIAIAGVVLAVFGPTRSYVASIVSAGMFLLVNWEQLKVVRPQLFGVTCFSALACMLLGSRRRTGRHFVVIPLMFVVWANAHGSFAIGLTFLGLTIAGAFIDVGVRSRSLRLAWASRKWRSPGLLLLLCCLAVLVNPFGWKIYSEVLRVGSHPNVSTMFEWWPMSLRMRQGRAMAFAVFVLTMLLLTRRRRIRATELLGPVAMGLLAVWSCRMVNWFAPLVAIAIGRHIHAAMCWFSRPARSSPGKRLRFGILNAILILALVSQTSLGKTLTESKMVTNAQLLSTSTPIRVAQFLNGQDLPKGVSLIPAEWAGFVMYTLKDRIESYINLHVHVIPEAVWQEYLSLVRGPDSLESRLRNLDINLVVVDQRRHQRLLKQMKTLNEFVRIYGDSSAVVFRRAVPNLPRLKTEKP